MCVNENCLDQQRRVCVNRLRKMLSFGLDFSFTQHLRCVNEDVAAILINFVAIRVQALFSRLPSCMKHIN